MTESNRHAPTETETKIPDQVKDFSGLEPWFVTQQIEHLIPVAEKIVVFPDLSPTDMKNKIIPTGSVVEFNIEETPHFLEFVRGADIGCAVLMSNIQVSKQDFQRNQKALDEVHKQIKEDRSVSLGGGNHFIDFVTNQQGNVSVVIHTGSYRDRQRDLSNIIKNKPEDTPWQKITEEYMLEYQKVIDSGNKNRLELLEIIYKVYGKGEISFHEPHNTIDLDQNKKTATIYKGAIHVSDTSKRLLLPSSMDTPMSFYIPGETVGESTLWGAPHGTGRAVARGEMKKLNTKQERPNIMLVTGITPPKTELPLAYRSIVQAETTMLNNKLMRYKEEGDIERLKVIGYIGHI